MNFELRFDSKGKLHCNTRTLLVGREAKVVCALKVSDQGLGLSFREMLWTDFNHPGD